MRAMNARAQQLGLATPTTPTRSGSTTRATTRPRATSSRLDAAAAPRPFFRRTVDRAQATLRSGDRPRTLDNRNRLVRQPLVNGVKTGHTQQAGYVLVGSGRRDGITLISVVLGAPSEAARDADTLRAAGFGLHALPAGHAPVARGRRARPRADPLPPRRAARARRGRRSGASCARGSALRARAWRRRTRSTGPIRRGPGARDRESLRRRARRGRCRSSRRRRARRRPRADGPSTGSRGRCGSLLVGRSRWPVPCSCGAQRAPRGRRRRRAGARRPEAA